MITIVVIKLVLSIMNMKRRREMSNTIRPSEAKKRQKDFFKERAKENSAWTLRVESQGQTQEFIGVNWQASSRFGKVENRVVVDSDGRPLFDRPAYWEAPNVNIVAWGRDQKEEVRIAILQEERPHADHPEASESTTPLTFSQVPMGFLEKLIGKDQMETGQEGAAREVEEETGSAIRSWSRPNYPRHNPSPSFVSSWSEIYFVEVDLEKIERLKQDKTEAIFKAEYVSIPSLLAKIKEGQSKDGAVFRAATSLSVLMIFFAHYPELWTTV